MEITINGVKYNKIITLHLTNYGFTRDDGKRIHAEANFIIYDDDNLGERTLFFKDAELEDIKLL